MASKLTWEHQVKYVYLRTKLNIENSDRAITAFAAVCYYPTYLLSLRPGIEAWNNGVVFRIFYPGSARDLANDLRDGLKEFDAWAIYGTGSDFYEFIDGGPLSMCLNAAQRFTEDEQHAPIAQLFIMFKERDRNTELTVERLRSCFRAAQCRPGFYFQDGRVLFLHSTEPGSMILQRCEHHIKTLSASIVCDAESDTYSVRGFEPKAWQLVDLEELGFVA